MTTRTSDEARDDFVEKMGQPLGTQFAALWQEVVHLHFKWAEFVELFGSKPSRIDLLNQAAPAFFRIVQDTLWEGILLHLARLTDAAVSGGRQARTNLTVLNLPDLVHNLDTKARVQKLVDVFQRQNTILS